MKTNFLKHNISAVAAVLSVMFALLIVGPVFLYAEEYHPPSYIEIPDTETLSNYPPGSDSQYLPGTDAPAFGPGVYTAGPGGVAQPAPDEARAAAAEAAAKKAREDQAAAMAKAFTCLGGGGPLTLFINIKGCVANLMDIAMWLAARTLWIAGVLLNMTLYLTLNLNTVLEQLPIVDIGWKVLRDIANIVFIFITLWCGISITLGIGDGGKKAWGYLAQMVLVALFINFSLFITKAVVDASNIAALHFYSLIVEPGKEKDFDSGLSEAFMYGLKLSTLYNAKQIGSGEINADSSLIGSVDKTSLGGKLSFTNIILIGFFGSLFIVVAAWVFFAAAIMFIYRAITLIFLMILSPLAFVGLILPGASGMAHQWWSKLWSQAFFAPLYLALAYVVVRTINASTFQGVIGGGAPGTGFAAALTTTSFGPVSVIFNFVILIGFMVGCLIVAQSLGAKGSEMAMAGWQKIKGAAIGVAGATVRGTIKAPSVAIRGMGDAVSGKSGIGKWMASTKLLNNKLFSVKKMQESKFGQTFGKTAGVASRAADIRHLEERAGQSWLGQTTIGKGIRAVTTGAIANLKIGDKSLEGAHKEAEEQRTARHVISSITQVRNAESDLRPLREEQNQHQEGVHEAQAAQEQERQALAQAQTPPATPQQRLQTAEAQAALTQAQAPQLSAQQQATITAALAALTQTEQNFTAAQATIASQQQAAIAAAQAALTQAKRALTQNPTDVTSQQNFETARQRLAQAQIGSPQQQQQIEAAMAAFTQAEQNFTAAQATVASEQQTTIATALAAFTQAERALTQNPTDVTSQQNFETARQRLAQAQAPQLSAQRQGQIDGLQQDIRNRHLDIEAALAAVASQQQAPIAAALAAFTQAEQNLAQNPTNVIEQQIVRDAQQRLAQARAGTPQQQQQIADERKELRLAEEALATERATVASQQQAAIAKAQAALTTAQAPRPLTPAQQAAVTTATAALAVAETNLTNATGELQAFQSAHEREIRALTRRKSEAYAAVSPAEYVKYAPKTDIINNMEFGDTPLSIYNAVIADEHRLNEHEKEEATDNFLRRVNEVARRGGARTVEYNNAVTTLQRNLNQFGARREQIMSRLAPQLRADVEREEATRAEILERLARMAQTTQAPPPGGTPPPGNPRP